MMILEDTSKLTDKANIIKLDNKTMYAWNYDQMVSNMSFLELKEKIDINNKIEDTMLNKSKYEPLTTIPNLIEELFLKHNYNVIKFDSIEDGKVKYLVLDEKVVKE